jgi:hypothetical protein
MNLRPLLILPLLLPALGHADTALKYENTSAPGDGMVIQARNGDVTMGTRESWILVKNGELKIYIFDGRSRTYMVMDEETAKRIGQQVDSAQQQMNAMMEQQMKNMTEEQKAQVRQLMGDKMPGAAPRTPPKTTVKRLGEETVAGVTCLNLMVLLDGKPSGDACVATAGVLSVDPDDYKAMVNATDTMRKIMEQMTGKIDNDAISLNLRAMKGIPIRMRDLVDGEETLLASRSSAALAPESFEVPGDFQKRDMLQ